MAHGKKKGKKSALKSVVPISVPTTAQENELISQADRESSVGESNQKVSAQNGHVIAINGTQPNSTASITGKEIEGSDNDNESEFSGTEALSDESSEKNASPKGDPKAPSNLSSELRAPIVVDSPAGEDDTASLASVAATDGSIRIRDGEPGGDAGGEVYGGPDEFANLEGIAEVVTDTDIANGNGSSNAHDGEMSGNSLENRQECWEGEETLGNDHESAVSLELVMARAEIARKEQAMAAQKEEYQQEIEAANSKATLLEKKLQIAVQLQENTDMEVRSLKSKAAELEEGIKEAQFRDRQHAEWKSVVESELAVAKSTQLAHEKEKQEILQELQVMRDTNKTLAEEVKSYKQKCADMELILKETKISTSQALRASAEVSEKARVAEEQYNEAMRQRQVLVSELEESKVNMGKLAKQLSDAMKRVKQAGELSEQLASRDNELADLKGHLQERDQKLSEFEEKLEQLTEKLKDVSQERDTTSSKHMQLMASFQKMENRLMSSAADAEFMKMEHEAIKSRLGSKWTRWPLSTAIVTGAVVATVGFMSRTSKATSS